MALVDGALAWMSVRLGMAVKSVPPPGAAALWQALQPAVAEVGIWLAGLLVMELKSATVWQFEQSPLVGWGVGSTTLKPNVPGTVCGRVWKPVYLEPADMTVVGIG